MSKNPSLKALQEMTVKLNQACATDNDWFAMAYDPNTDQWEVATSCKDPIPALAEAFYHLQDIWEQYESSTDENTIIH